jgi:hypothetical protein
MAQEESNKTHTPSRTNITGRPALRKACDCRFVTFIVINLGDFYFPLLHVAANLDAKSVKHQDKQTALQN